MDAPIKLGEVVELEITAQNPNGEGIGRKEDFIIFVKNAKKGQTCKARITDIKRTFAIAEKL